MYRLLITGAIISTALVFQTQLNAGEANINTEIQSQSNSAEDQFSQVFEETKIVFMENKPASAILQIAIKDMPIIPVEKGIQDFPSAIETTEKDPVRIAQFYTDAAKAYEKEATKLYESTLRIYESKTRNEQQQRLNAYRNENIKYADDYTVDKGSYSEISGGVPFKSEKYTPSAIRRDSQIFQNKEYREQKARFDELTLRSNFYLAMANAFSPQKSE